jgi:hypothetical protein
MYRDVSHTNLLQFVVAALSHNGQEGLRELLVHPTLQIPTHPEPQLLLLTVIYSMLQSLAHVPLPNQFFSWCKLLSKGIV